MLKHAYRAVSLLTLLAITSPGWAKQQEASDDNTVCPAGQSVLVDVLYNDAQLGDGLRILKAYKPAHGSASIENGRIRYTPNAGFQGSDTFRYKVQAAKSQPAEATVNVEVGAGGVVLRLAGQVVDAPIPNATVTVSIGGIDFTTHADANGNYVLDIAALHGDAFVTLTATGTSPSGAAVRFYSAVGEIARLSTAAGSDGVLVRDEFNQVNITNLSTAQYTLLTDANGGAISSDQQLLPLVQNIDLDKMLQLAAIIKLVVDDNVPLPPGTTDALALISDPTAIQTFKDNLAPNQLQDAVAAVSSDPALTPGFRAGALPSGYAMISPSAPGTIRTGISNGVLIHFDGSATATAGSGSIIDSAPESAPPMTWQLVDGDLVITPTTPWTTPFGQSDVSNRPECVDTVGFEEKDTELQFRLTRLQDGAGMDYLKVTSTTDVLYHDLDPSDGCVPPADGPVDYSYVRLGFEDGQGELKFTANEALGRVALSHLQPGVYPVNNGFRNWAAAIFDFGTHAVNITGTEPAFASSIGADGRLYVQVTNASTHEVTQYEHRRYQLDGSLGEGIFTIATLPDGTQVSIYSLTSRQNNGATFGNLYIPARWRSGFDVSQIQGDGSVPFGFSLIFNNDVAQTGTYDSVNTLGVHSFSNPYTWSVENGEMVARSYRNQPYGPQPSCTTPAPGSNCWLRRVRTWTPLSFTADGNRVYVLERIYDRLGPNLSLDLVAERVNFYDRE